MDHNADWADYADYFIYANKKSYPKLPLGQQT